MFSDPIAFTIGGLSIHWYALFILLGAVLGTWLTSTLARKRGLTGISAWDMAPIVVFAAILGARAYYVMLQWDDFSNDLIGALNIRSGGLSIHGGIIAGALAIIVYGWIKRQPLLAWFDVIVPGLALGQAIGRWGNYANQEAFGRPTDLPWGIFIRPERRPDQFVEFSHFHPTFFYESLLNLINAAVLAWLVLKIGRNRRLREGDALGAYLIIYGLIRLPLEWLRTDSLYFGPLPAAYWASGALILAGAAVIVAVRVFNLGRTFEERAHSPLVNESRVEMHSEHA